MDGDVLSVLVEWSIIIIIIQEISIAHSPELKAGAQRADRKTRNEVTYIKTRTKDKQSAP